MQLIKNAYILRTISYAIQKGVIAPLYMRAFAARRCFAYVYDPAIVSLNQITQDGLLCCKKYV